MRSIKNAEVVSMKEMQSERSENPSAAVAASRGVSPH